MFGKLVSMIDRKSDQLLYFLVALLLILGSAYSIYNGNTVRFYPDECDYSDLAQNLAATGVFTLDGQHQTAYRPPGYPVFLAALAFFGGGIVHFRLMNYLALAVVLCCVYRILKEQSTSLAACLGTLMVIGYPLAFYTAGTLYPQTLAAALFLLALFFSTRRQMKSLDYFLCGLFMGCLLLTVPSFSFVLVVFAVWLLLVPPKRASKVWGVFLFPIFLLLGTWTLRNYLVFHTFVFISTNSSGMLLGGNFEDPTSDAGRRVEFDKYRAEAESLGEIERERYYQAKAIEYMLAHKADTVRLYFLKLLDYFNYHNNLVTKGVTSPVTDLVLMLSYGPPLLLFILRLALAKLLKLSPFEILLATIYLSNAFVSAIFIPRIRYRLPFDFLLIMLAALFLEKMISGEFLKHLNERVKLDRSRA
jgi:4-amino-4-deoxy-L-arabinose transferase-like glycosyltransferase